MCTKGYGYTPEILNWSCPAEIEPYERLFAFEERKKDEFAWLQGQYIYEAVITALDNAFAGKKSKLKYTEKPYTVKARENKGQIAHDEKMKKVKGLFMQLEVMKANFELSHPKKDGDNLENK
jgi:hypothetical protein